jgi:hypothetical protein
MKSNLLIIHTTNQANIFALGFAILLLLFSTITRAAVFVSNFDPVTPPTLSIPPSWQIIRLETHVPATTYRQRYWDGVNAIEANADASMALLGRLVDVDLHETPILCWLWRTDSVVKSANMTKRQGDDYAARVYLAFSLPKEALTLADKAALTIARGFFGSHVPDGAINYVWDNMHPIGTRMPNAYTSRAQMVVLRTGNVDSGKWVAERVNVLDDLHRTFGSTGGKLKLLAIASDSDNTKEKARAGFADIAFVRADEACPTTGTQN